MGFANRLETCITLFFSTLSGCFCTLYSPEWYRVQWNAAKIFVEPVVGNSKYGNAVTQYSPGLTETK